MVTFSKDSSGDGCVRSRLEYWNSEVHFKKHLMLFYWQENQNKENRNNPPIYTKNYIQLYIIIYNYIFIQKLLHM